MTLIKILIFIALLVASFLIIFWSNPFDNP
jgi:hypothetical protein